jgi:hypothetical protein
MAYYCVYFKSEVWVIKSIDFPYSSAKLYVDRIEV